MSSFDKTGSIFTSKITNKNDNNSDIKLKTNYDGTEIGDAPHIISIRKSWFSGDGVQQKAPRIFFGFEDGAELMFMLRSAIKDATAKELVCDERQLKQFHSHFGAYAHEDPTSGKKYTLSINLILSHAGEMIRSKYMRRQGKINSTSEMIRNVLCPNSGHSSAFDSKVSSAFDSKVSSAFDSKVSSALDLSNDYQTLVEKRIKQLISEKHKDYHFPLVSFTCYHEVCQEVTVMPRLGNGKESPADRYRTTATCKGCNNATFCRNCSKPSHGISECSDTVDPETMEYLNRTTKKCPDCGSRIQRISGCNHMTCGCGTEFCWLCEEKYEWNQISQHYRGYDARSMCRGRANQTLNQPLNQPLNQLLRRGAIYLNGAAWVREQEDQEELDAEYERQRLEDEQEDQEQLLAQQQHEEELLALQEEEAAMQAYQEYLDTLEEESDDELSDDEEYFYNEDLELEILRQALDDDALDGGDNWHLYNEVNNQDQDEDAPPHTYLNW